MYITINLLIFGIVLFATISGCLFISRNRLLKKYLDSKIISSRENLENLSRIFEYAGGDGIIILDADGDEFLVRLYSKILRELDKENISKIITAAKKRINDYKSDSGKCEIALSTKTSGKAHLSLNISPLYPNNDTDKSRIIFINY